ncbi:MAG: RelA/SpoT family protein [Prevotellaceae bacterium]|jgi:GTP pyrophosphokinase|nr:RelA/SpoT family protein [Prevotellaceae bacterium]
MAEESKNREMIAVVFAELEQIAYDRCSEEERMSIREAFNLATEAHKGVNRKSGEPYILHPIAVAKIVVENIGLAYKSIVASLLHDVVEDADYTVDDIRQRFGDKIASIVDGLTKIEGVFGGDTTLQAENFKRILQTLTDDLRVILIKMADRLHNMRTLDAMPENKRAKIVGETMYFFIPLAHRLGLQGIKTELENLCLKNSLPEEYNTIRRKLEEGEEARQEFIQRLIQPVKEKLLSEGLQVEVKGATRSVYSVWRKINSRNIPFEEVNDLFAVRIIFEASTETTERAQCWNIYQLITEVYRSLPDKLKDWTNTPKVNGYEALHCTLIGPLGSWVEVQIRSQRMDEIATNGVVAHWKYKIGIDQENELGKWLEQVKDMFNHPVDDQSTLAFLDRFQSGLLAFEVYVYTPKGESKALPQGATVLDFAYNLHTDLGNKAIAAKVNHKLQSLNYVLKSGDQIEVITAETQRPQTDWIDMVVTPKARSRIIDALKEELEGNYQQGQQMLEAALRKIGITLQGRVVNKLVIAYKAANKQDLFTKIAAGVINLSDLETVLRYSMPSKQVSYWGVQVGAQPKGKILKEKINKKIPYLLEELAEGKTKLSYKVAPCCSPIPGDDIICFIDETGTGVTVHKTKCREALHFTAQHGERIIAARWVKHRAMSFLVRLEIRGVDRIGILKDIVDVITGELSVNIRKVNLMAHDGIFEAEIDLYVHDTEDLEALIENVKKTKGVVTVKRATKVDS